MGDRRHGLRVNLVIAFREDLIRGALELQLEAGAAGAAHAERLPGEARLQRVIVLGDGQQYLVGAGGVVGAAGDGDDSVGLRAIGNHGGVADQRDLGVGALDRGGGKADIAAVLPLGGRGGQQHLFGCDPAHQLFVPWAPGAVPDQAGDLGLMHRKDHRRGGAGAAERVAHLGDVGDRRTVAAEPVRDLDAEEFLLPRGVDGGFREPGVAVDLLGFRRRRGGDRRRPAREGAAVDDEGLAGLFCGVVVEPCFLHVHGRMPPWLCRYSCASSRNAHRSLAQLPMDFRLRI